MRFSLFGHLLQSPTGILSLMDDLGEALSSGRDVSMLGGGNPAYIPEMQAKFRSAIADLAEGDQFDRIVGDYDGPQGNPFFIEALARLLRTYCHWDVGPENIAITNGSQSSFFVLFNALAGRYDDGTSREILLPVIPEYIGYTDVGLGEKLFRARQPNIELIGDQLFKYHVDFENLEIGPDISAICVSRPTNPTGNLLTDEEIEHLRTLAHTHDIPLIVDAAYGSPFPNIVFGPATPVWDEKMIVCMSLSKLGLPGVRTGMVIASEPVIKVVTAANAILNLAPGSFGPGLTTKLVETGEVLDLANNVIQPFYRARAERAVERLSRGLRNYPFRAHKPEGAIFLWLWFKDFPITTLELYRKLKERDVIVIAGEHFFPGLADPWRHQHECIRVSYAQDEAQLARGIDIIIEEVRRAYDQADKT